MKIARCGRCRHGMTAMDGETPYTVCALLPPAPIELNVPHSGAPSVTLRQMTWQRPTMVNVGWCGQFKIGWLRLFGYGART